MVVHLKNLSGVNVLAKAAKRLFGFQPASTRVDLAVYSAIGRLGTQECSPRDVADASLARWWNAGMRERLWADFELVAVALTVGCRVLLGLSTLR